MRNLNRRWAAGLISLLVLAVVGLLGPSPSAAADEEQPARITFSEVTVPSTGDGQVVVAGTIANTTSGPLYNLQAMVWRDSTPITTPEALDSVLQSEPTQPLGRRVCCEIGTFQDLTTPDKPLEAGQEVKFRITLTMDDLELPDREGVYLIGLHLRGSTDGSAPWTLSRARTFALRTTDSTPAPMVTSVVVLSSRPSMVRDDVFVDDHLATELAPGGRLHTLLESAAREKVSHAIDPSLLDEVIMMSDGYQVTGADGKLRPGEGASVADDWLVAFEKLSGDRYRLPYAMPDLTALAAMPDNMGAELISYADKAGQQVPALAYAPVLVLNSSNEWNPDGLLLADRFEASAVVLNNTDAQGVLLQPVHKTPLVRTDPTIFDGGPGPDPVGDRIRIRQRMHAEALVQALDGQPVPVRIIDTPQAAALDEATPAGTRRRPLSELLKQSPSSWTGDPEWTTSMDQAQLQPEQLALVTELVETQALFNDLLVDPTDRQTTSYPVIARGVSSWWRGAAKEQEAFLAPARAEMEGVTDGDTISLRAPSRVTLSMREGTTFPATISNNYSREIQVRPVFESVQGQRIRFPEQPVVVIAPGESVTVNINPVAEVNGLVDVSGRLTTPSGHQVSDKVNVVVEVSDLGWAAWVIVLISGAVLVGTTTLRIRQVRARQVQGGDR
ncbi:DUF6049 family protein [Enemella sp. A6]|uniref:DUF6049 family protein n=1 Tax=Enemella sp. A6 TaxID=3440152 RepID=UPI003EB9ED76